VCDERTADGNELCVFLTPPPSSPSIASDPSPYHFITHPLKWKGTCSQVMFEDTSLFYQEKEREGHISVLQINIFILFVTRNRITRREGVKYK
jgi:hypothetical protein